MEEGKHFFSLQFLRQHISHFTYLLRAPPLLCPVPQSPGNVSTSEDKTHVGPRGRTGQLSPSTIAPLAAPAGSHLNAGASTCTGATASLAPGSGIRQLLQVNRSPSRFPFFCRVIFNLDQSQIQFTLLSHKQLFQHTRGHRGWKKSGRGTEKQNCNLKKCL